VLLLSPPKLLMILVIALIVLGPDKLPSAARRVGSLWSEFNRWRAHLETEVRATFPDLPSTTEIARAVRSPMSMLDRLAEAHDETSVAEMAGAAPADAAPGVPTDDVLSVAGPSGVGPPSPTAELPVPARAHPVPRIDASVGPDVSSMN
jgi:Sec-independent protein translocase protein TatA